MKPAVDPLAALAVESGAFPPSPVRRVAVRRRLVDWQHQTQVAAAMLAPLPKRGESVHGLLGQAIRLSSFIPAIQTLANRPLAATISTLGLDVQTLDLFGAMLEAGTLTRADVLLSKYFEASDAETCAEAVSRLRQLGQRAAVARTHAKIILLRPKAGSDRFTIESSANLRSCQSLEAFVLTNDAPLYDFHARWIETHL